MTQNGRRICALIPAYNEETRISRTIEALQSRREIDRIVVIDDGSTDRTAENARSAGAEVHTQTNRGKGAALTAAYLAARGDAEIYLLLDADLCASATESVKLLTPILEGSAQMTVGVIPPDPAFAESGESGGLGVVVQLARWGIKHHTGVTFSQPLSGQRAVLGAVLEDIGGHFANGFGVEVDLTIRVIRSGHRVVEVDTEFRHAVTGSDLVGIAHRGRQLFDVARALQRIRPARTAGTAPDVPDRI